MENTNWMISWPFYDQMWVHIGWYLNVSIDNFDMNGDLSVDLSDLLLTKCISLSYCFSHAVQRGDTRRKNWLLRQVLVHGFETNRFEPCSIFLTRAGFIAMLYFRNVLWARTSCFHAISDIYLYFGTTWTPPRYFFNVHYRCRRMHVPSEASRWECFAIKCIFVLSLGELMRKIFVFSFFLSQRKEWKEINSKTRMSFLLWPLEDLVSNYYVFLALYKFFVGVGCIFAFAVLPVQSDHFFLPSSRWVLFSSHLFISNEFKTFRSFKSPFPTRSIDYNSKTGSSCCWSHQLFSIFPENFKCFELSTTRCRCSWISYIPSSSMSTFDDSRDTEKWVHGRFSRITSSTISVDARAFKVSRLYRYDLLKTSTIAPWCEFMWSSACCVAS